MSTPTHVTSTLQDIVRHDLAIKASIHDINTSDGPVDNLQRINAEARKHVQDIKRILDQLEIFAKGEFCMRRRVPLALQKSAIPIFSTLLL